MYAVGMVKSSCSLGPQIPLRCLLCGGSAVAIAMLFGGQGNAESLRSAPVVFRADDAEISCRALLPQCFRRQDWAELCRNEAEFREAHRETFVQALDVDQN